MGEKEIRQFISDFHNRIRKTDPFVTQVLQAHFEVEGLIDRVLKAIAKSPEHLELKRNRSFAQRVRWIRAFGPMGDDKRWQLLLALTNLRNNIAHKPDGPERKGALRKLREKLARSRLADNSILDEQEWRDYNLVFTASMESSLFLGEIWGHVGK